MDLSLSEEQLQLRETVRKFLEEVSTEEAVRELMADERGFDAPVWTRLAEELGLIGLTIPEEHGGAGLGPVELAVVLEEMGASLLCAPFFSTVVLAATALLESDSHQSPPASTACTPSKAGRLSHSVARGLPTNASVIGLRRCTWRCT